LDSFFEYGNEISLTTSLQEENYLYNHSNKNNIKLTSKQDDSCIFTVYNYNDGKKNSYFLKNHKNEDVNFLLQFRIIDYETNSILSQSIDTNNFILQKYSFGNNNGYTLYLERFKKYLGYDKDKFIKFYDQNELKEENNYFYVFYPLKRNYNVLYSNNTILLKYLKSKYYLMLNNDNVLSVSNHENYFNFFKLNPVEKNENEISGSCDLKFKLYNLNNQKIYFKNNDSFDELIFKKFSNFHNDGFSLFNEKSSLYLGLFKNELKYFNETNIYSRWIPISYFDSDIVYKNLINKN
jgi:hypothetical protein